MGVEGAMTVSFWPSSSVCLSVNQKHFRVQKPRILTGIAPFFTRYSQR